MGQPARPEQGSHQVGHVRDVPALVGDLQRLNADAIEEFVTKHGVKLLTTPPEINQAFLKTWDEFAAAEAAKNPFFKKVYESQRLCLEGGSREALHVSALRAQADHYWPVKQ